ncbi:MAG: T9SS type A sorting domain-containing protein [Bacteroidetes bacterium]|nr:T9SS type A sorting domain-containing protein [Bacteroidota bacterium]
MKNKLTIALLLSALAFVFTSAMLSSNGRAGKTGAPGETTCTSCHGDYALNGGPGSVTIAGISGGSYIPGTTYNMSITVAQTNFPLFGLDCEVLTSANTNAGTLAITNAVETRLLAATVSGVSRQNVVQAAGGGQTLNSHTFAFNWTAPAAGTGTVTFYYTGMAADNTGDEINDYVYSGSLVLTEGGGCTTPAQPGTIAGATTVCSGSSQTYSVAAVSGATDYIWTLPGGWSGTSTTNSITATASSTSGNISVAAHNTCGTSTAQVLAVTSSASVTPGVSIAANPGTTICSGTSVTFTATPTNGGTTPSYQWKLNGANVGTNSATYTNAALANGNTVSCVMTSNANCASPTTATSNTLTMVVNAAVTPSVSIAANPGTTICAGTSVTFTATPTNGGTTPSYQWKLNGANVGTNSATYTNAALANGNTVSCVMTSNANCASPATATSNTLTMTVTPAVTPSVSIGANPGTTICAGTSVTFTATPTNGGTTPSYQWKLNGANVGTNSATYTNAALANGNTVSCVMTSNANCASPASATSNTLTMVVNAAVTPSVSIGANPGTTICAGTSVTFTATPTNGGTTPSYQWKLNGANVGTNSATYTNAALANGNTISCVMTSNANCVSAATATSNTLTIVVTTSITPTVSIAPAPGNTICAGTNVTFTATPTNGGTTPAYQWKLNGNNVGTNASTYSNSALANNDQVSCVMTSNAGCLSTPTATSNTITMVVNAAVTPSVSISANPGTTICSGTSVTFTATPTNGGTTPSYQWKLNGANVGTNSVTYTNAALANGNTISCVLTSNAGCASPTTATSNTLTMVVNASVTPAVSIAASPGTTICSGTSVTFTATPTNGGTPSYQWKLNGGNVGTNSATYTNASLASADVVSCIMTSTAACASPLTATSNSLTIVVSGTVVPAVNITANPGNTICAGTSVTFTATPVNGGTTPSYQWKLNGGNVGTNTSTYTNAALVNGDQVSCVMTSNSGCASPLTATSNVITMTLTTSVTPGVSISANPGATICQGTSVTFTATPTNGGTTPAYQWKLNGANVGTNSNTYTNAALANGNTVSCVMTSNASCVSPATATSNTVTMVVNASVTPSVSITANPGTTICSGTNVTFTATPVNGGTTPAYQWKLNGTNVGTNSNTYSNSALANGDVVSCELTTNASCATVLKANSNTLAMVISTGTTPAVSISSIPSTAVCPGTTITFTATPTNGGTTPAYQWTLNGVNAGTNSPVFASNAFVNGDLVQCTMTSNSTCASVLVATSNSINVAISALPQPIINAGGPTSFCQGGNVVLTASFADAASYSWTPGGATSASITVTSTGTYTVTGTNTSGCSAASSPVTVTVNPLPVVTLSAFAQVCSTDASFALTGGNPAGGTYSGTGVTGGNFDPAVAGIGTFQITYSYTNTAGCSNTASASITVTNCGGGGCTTAPLRPGYISGPGNVVCGQTSVTYSIAPITGATSYNWTVPANVQIVSNTGTSITVNFLPGFHDGDIRVTASNACGTSPARSKHIETGNMNTSRIIGEENVCPDQLIQVYSIPAVIGATSYSWTVGGGASFTANLNSITVDFTGVTTEHVLIRVRVTNACGNSQTRSLWVEVKDHCDGDDHDRKAGTFNPSQIQCGIYPNPGNGQFTIQVTSMIQSNCIISLYDLIGNEVVKNSVSLTEGINTVEFNATNATPGIYFLKIAVVNGETQTIRLVIDK